MNIQIGRFWLSLGWFSGEPFVLFLLLVGEFIGYPKIDMVTIFSIQVLKLSLAFGWMRKEAEHAR